MAWLPGFTKLGVPRVLDHSLTLPLLRPCGGLSLVAAHAVRTLTFGASDIEFLREVKPLGAS